MMLDIEMQRPRQLKGSVGHGTLVGAGTLPTVGALGVVVSASHGEALHELREAMPYGLLVRDVADVTADGESAPPEQT